MKMTHVMLGTNNVDKARIFYDAVLSVLGYDPAAHDPNRATYAAPNTPSVMIGPPFDGHAATFGNGSMTGFSASSPVEVDAFCAAALSHGGRCDGPPGSRPYSRPTYGAYVWDPDGNKLSILFFADTPAAQSN